MHWSFFTVLEYHWIMSKFLSSSGSFYSRIPIISFLDLPWVSSLSIKKPLSFFNYIDCLLTLSPFQSIFPVSPFTFEQSLFPFHVFCAASFSEDFLFISFWVLEVLVYMYVPNVFLTFLCVCFSSYFKSAFSTVWPKSCI